MFTVSLLPSLSSRSLLLVMPSFHFISHLSPTVFACFIFHLRIFSRGPTHHSSLFFREGWVADEELLLPYNSDNCTDENWWGWKAFKSPDENTIMNYTVEDSMTSEFYLGPWDPFGSKYGNPSYR